MAVPQEAPGANSRTTPPIGMILRRCAVSLHAKFRAMFWREACNGIEHANEHAGEIPAAEANDAFLNKLDFHAQAHYWRNLLRHHLLRHAAGTPGLKKMVLKGRCSLRAAQEAFRDLGTFKEASTKRGQVHFIEIRSFVDFVNFACFEVSCRFSVTTLKRRMHACFMSRGMSHAISCRKLHHPPPRMPSEAQEGRGQGNGTFGRQLRNARQDSSTSALAALWEIESSSASTAQASTRRYACV